MIPCAVCGTDIDAITTMYVVTEFLPELGTIALQHPICSIPCMCEWADRIELAVEGGAA